MQGGGLWLPLPHSCHRRLLLASMPRPSPQPCCLPAPPSSARPVLGMCPPCTVRTQAALLPRVPRGGRALAPSAFCCPKMLQSKNASVRLKSPLYQTSHRFKFPVVSRMSAFSCFVGWTELKASTWGHPGAVPRGQHVSWVPLGLRLRFPGWWLGPTDGSYLAALSLCVGGWLWRPQVMDPFTPGRPWGWSAVGLERSGPAW